MKAARTTGHPHVVRAQAQGNRCEKEMTDGFAHCAPANSAGQLTKIIQPPTRGGQADQLAYP